MQLKPMPEMTVFGEKPYEAEQTPRTPDWLPTYKGVLLANLTTAAIALVLYLIARL